MNIWWEYSKERERQVFDLPPVFKSQMKSLHSQQQSVIGCLTTARAERLALLKEETPETMCPPLTKQSNGPGDSQPLKIHEEKQIN
jgi:hypothetical protein